MSDLNFELELVEKAQLLHDSGRHQLALDTLQDFQNPPSDFVFLNYCTLYVNCCLSLDKIQNAHDFIISQLEKSPSESHLYYLVSRVYLDMDKTKKSLKSILKAIELEPEVDEYHSTATAIYFDLEKMKKAEFHLQKAEDLDPEAQQNIYLRSLILIRNGNHKEADQSIRRGLDLYPESTLLQNLFTHLDANHQPKISKLKELSLNALEENPFDDNARDSLLYSLKNSNRIVRFFVANGFNRYKLDWTPWRVVLMILFWKGTLLWGGFAIIYLLITWSGTALFYTVVRRHPRYKYILPKHGINMSNTFLAVLLCSIIGITIIASTAHDSETLFGVIAGCLFLLLTSISYFEIHGKSGKLYFGIFLLISILILITSTSSMLLFGILSILFLLIYAFLFTLDITFK